MANGTAMGELVTASADRRTAQRTVAAERVGARRARPASSPATTPRLREVYDQYASFVYGLAVRVIGDPRAAEDVSQDVFVAFWERPARSIPTAGACGPGWARSPTAAPSTTCAARRRAAVAPSARRAARCRARRRGDGDRAAHRRARARRARRCCPPTAARHPARVLRREDLPPGRGDARHPRRHRQVATAPGAAADRRRPRSRRR